MTAPRELRALAAVRRLRADRAAAAVAASAAELRRDEAAHAAALVAADRQVASADRLERDWMRRLEGDAVPEAVLRAGRDSLSRAFDASEATATEAAVAAAGLEAGRARIEARRGDWRRARRANERLDAGLAESRAAEERRAAVAEESESDELAMALRGGSPC